MNARSVSVSASVESIPVPHGSRTSDHADKPGRGRWKLVLESRWQRKIDEVVILSQARSGLASESGETAIPPGVKPSRRLGARIDEALGEVAAIEEALARLDDGSYGVCAGCDRPMAAAWLADAPETRYCPDCSLRLVSWQPPSKRRATAVDAQQPPQKTTGRKRRQARRADSGVPALTAVARHAAR